MPADRRAAHPRKDPAAEAKLLQKVSQELMGLKAMKIGALRARYLDLFGSPTHSKNAQYLCKKLGHRIQELAEGGLSERALLRIDQLAPEELPEPRVKRYTSAGRKPNASKRPVPPASPEPPPTPGRDPRLPSVGTVLNRTYKGTPHEVTVLEDGFVWNGAQHPSLSAIARAITGTAWNGFLFFGLIQRGAK